MNYRIKMTNNNNNHKIRIIVQIRSKIYKCLLLIKEKNSNFNLQKRILIWGRIMIIRKINHIRRSIQTGRFILMTIIVGRIIMIDLYVFSMQNLRFLILIYNFILYIILLSIIKVNTFIN